MADSGTTFEQDVILDADGKPLFDALTSIQKYIDQIQTSITNISKDSFKSATDFQQSLISTTRQLTQAMQAMKTLQQNTPGTPQFASQQRSVATQTKSASDFARGIAEGADAADNLKAKINQVNQAIANGGAAGKNMTLAQKEQLDLLGQELAQLNKIDSAYDKINSKIARTPNADFGPQQANVAAARALVSADASKPGQVDVTESLALYQRAIDELTEAVQRLREMRAQESREAIAAANAEEKAYMSYLDGIESSRQKGFENYEKLNAQEVSAEQKKLDQMEAAWSSYESNITDKAKAAQEARMFSANDKATNLANPKNPGLTSEDNANATLALQSQANALAADQEATAQRDLVVAYDAKLAAQERLAGNRAMQESAASDITSLEEVNSEIEKTIQRINELTEARGKVGTLSEAQGIQQEIQSQQQYQQTLNKTKSSLEEGEGAAGGFADHLKGAIGNAAIYGVVYGGVYAVIGAIKDGVTYAIQMQETMEQLGAIANATDSQLQSVKATIFDVGSNSKFTTLELAQVGVALAQMGMSTLGIQEGLKATSDLAMATGSTLKEASDAITAAMNTFNLQESEQGRIADVLTTALNATKLTVQQVVQGFQMAGVTADNAGISFTEFTAALAAMSAAGAKSRTAASGLNALLTGLIEPNQKLSDELRKLGVTYDDIDIKQHGFEQVLQNLQAAGFNATDAYATMSASAAKAFITLTSNGDQIDGLRIKLAQGGAAALAASKDVTSLSAQWTIFKNNLAQETDNDFGGVGTFFTDLLKKENDAQAEYAKITAAQQADMQKLADLQQSDDGSEAHANAVQAVQDHMDALGTTIQQVDANQKNFNADLADANTQYNNATNAVNQHKQSMDSLQQAINQTYARQNDLKDGSIQLTAQTLDLESRFVGLASVLGNTALSYGSLTNALRVYQQQQLAGLQIQLNTQAAAADLQKHAAFGNASQVYNQVRGSTLFTAQQKSLFSNVAKSPTGQNLNILSDMISQLSGPAKTLAEQFVQQVGAGLTALGNSNSAKFSAQVTGRAQDPANLALRNEANQLSKPGTSQATVKAYLAKLDTLGKQTGDAALKAFYAGLYEQVQGTNLGTPASLKPAKVKKTHDPAPHNAVVVANSDLADLQKQLDESIQDAKKPTNFADFQTESDNVDAKLTAWASAKMKDVATKIAAMKGLTDAQKDALLKAGQDEVQTETDKAARTLAQQLVSLIQSLVKAADDQLKLALAPGQQQLAVQQGLATSLTRENIKDKVPDYVTQNQARLVAQTSDQVQQDSIPAYQAHIDSYKTALADAQSGLDDLTKTGGTKNAIAAAELQVEDLKVKIDDSTKALDQLKASFQGADLLPKSLGDSLQQAIIAYRNANGLNNTFSDNLKMQLGTAVGDVGTQFTDFVTNIATGTKSIGQSFESMVQGILKALEQMAAQLVAKQLFGLLLGVATSALGGGSKGLTDSGGWGFGSAASLGSDDEATFAFNGGPIGYDVGGKVTNGSDARDSVHAKLAKGEWVVNKKSVDSVGDQFMANLNSHGAAAVSAMQSIPPINFSGGHQETNVWVVKPDQQPTMTKNDVLVTFQEDVLQGGETKKLIKAVANGG